MRYGVNSIEAACEELGAEGGASIIGGDIESDPVNSGQGSASTPNLFYQVFLNLYSSYQNTFGIAWPDEGPKMISPFRPLGQDSFSSKP